MYMKLEWDTILYLHFDSWWIFCIKSPHPCTATTGRSCLSCPRWWCSFPVDRNCGKIKDCKHFVHFWSFSLKKGGENFFRLLACFPINKASEQKGPSLKKESELQHQILFLQRRFLLTRMPICCCFISLSLFFEELPPLCNPFSLRWFRCNWITNYMYM